MREGRNGSEPGTRNQSYALLGKKEVHLFDLMEGRVRASAQKRSDRQIEGGKNANEGKEKRSSSMNGKSKVFLSDQKKRKTFAAGGRRRGHQGRAPGKKGKLD